jgi:DNA-binding transcriptional LysR family regulator
MRGNMDRLEAMSVLVTAIETGSLSAASRKLGMPLATVSRKVSELEALLRTRLVNRTSRRLELTEAGRSYVAACRQIIEDVDEAERAAAGEYKIPKGSLVVTAPVVFGRLHVLPVVTEFLKEFPEIDIRLVLADRVVDLLEDHVHVAIRIGKLPDSSLTAVRVGSIGLIACASPVYLSTRGLPNAPSDLKAHDCIAFEGLVSPTAWTFRSGKDDLTVGIHSRLVVTTAEAAIDAAIAGLGITRILSYQIVAARQQGSLATILHKYEPAPIPVSLVYDGRGLLPRKLRAFLDYAVPRLKTNVSKQGHSN